MKRIQCYILVFCFLLSLVGCSGQQADTTAMTAGDIAAVIQSSQKALPLLVQITSEEAEFASWLSNYYFLQAEQVTEGIVCYAEGVEASEIAVLVLADEKDSGTVETALSEYIQNRAGVFEGYAPEQAAIAKDGIVVVKGKYVALLICRDIPGAKAAFLSCFEDSSQSAFSAQSISNSEATKKVAAVPETESTESPVDSSAAAEPVPAEQYDPDAVLQAWQTGDDSALSECNRSILNAAKDVLATEIDDGMSDYAKELAIHDWITGWSSFDYGVFGRSAEDGFADDSDTPYGVLINRSAMCHGYSATFQLFMDMLDIECITVFGTPGGNGVEHSWNMVKLDGEWYCVDCAWDDPIGGTPGHRYFNVTSDDLRSGSIHKWDETAVPEATGTEYAYGNH